MTVYIDVLLALNLYINYFLIKSTTLITRRSCSRMRCVAGAFVGALGALIILLPELPFFTVILIKIALSAMIVFVAFGKQKPVDFAVCELFFLVANFTFAGVMLALWTFSAPLGMVWSNGTAYFNIPIAAIAAFTAAAYFTIKLIRRLSDKRLYCNKICTVKITANDTTVTLRGFSDTGNELCDYLSGKPVVVCRFDKVIQLAPQNVLDYYNGQYYDNLRLVPCKTISSESLVPIFKANISIDGKNADAFVGITKNPLGEDIDCIFNPKIISL